MPAVAEHTCYLSVPAIAERLGVDQHRVLNWVHSGQLSAVNIGDGHKRPRFRIAEVDLAAFLAGRSAGPQLKINRVRRRPLSASGIVEFF